MTSRTVSPLALAALLAGCGGSPTAPDADLPPLPVPLNPVDNALASSDTPTFSVRNAKGFDLGQADYTFHVLNPAGTGDLAAITVPAGRGQTLATAPQPLPRGLTLHWNVVARGPAGEATSPDAVFRTVAVTCLAGRDPFAKSVVDWFVPACSLAQNIYNDPSQVLGPPDAGGTAPDHFFGFISLGDRGYVTVDMEGCARDLPGDDVRVFQSVSKEPVSLYAAGAPGGPFVLVEYRKTCGRVLDGVFSHYCDFDLAKAEIPLTLARYFKIEDGEQYPCPGDTVSEGADIDAIQILHEEP